MVMMRGSGEGKGKGKRERGGLAFWGRERRPRVLGKDTRGSLLAQGLE
jgi:hypothetical protein